MTHLTKLIDHCMWANEAWIGFVEDNFGSDDYLLTRMSHILLGQQAWFQRIAGEEPDRQVWKTMRVPELRALHEKHSGIYESVLCETNRVVAYRRFTGEEYQSPVADILLHLTLHGTHHRGQMSTYASGKGVKPIITDFIQFCLVKGL